MRTRLNSLPLFWRVFGTNAAVLVLAFLALVFAPVTVSVPPATIELVVLAVGLVCLLALNLALLRPAFRPLDELAETMKRHDPLTPGVRVRVDGEPDVAALARTFNDMLDRLESERRDSARRALMVQEGERRRIARELHDEVGQTLTGVMLQVESLAAVIPDELREQLDELRETARQGTEEVRRIARRLRPEALEDLGLQSALAAWQARSASRRTFGSTAISTRASRCPSSRSSSSTVSHRRRSRTSPATRGPGGPTFGSNATPRTRS
jgi:two-component system, NarL family, sensor histidine kinase UhpB